MTVINTNATLTNATLTNTTSALFFSAKAEKALSEGKSHFNCPWGQVKLTEEGIVPFGKDRYVVRTEVWVCTPMSTWTCVYSGHSTGARSAYCTHVGAMMAHQRPLCGEYRFW